MVCLLFFPMNVTHANSPPNADEQLLAYDIGEAQGIESEVPQTPDDVEVKGKEALVDEDVNNEGIYSTQASGHSFISLGMPTQLTQPAASILDNEIDTSLFFQNVFFIRK
jgi:hypothetical protein